MHLFSFQLLLLGAPAVPAILTEHAGSTDSLALLSEVASLVSSYVPPPVYTQLTAAVASAASAASVTGDPGSLLVSAILATAPPGWFSSAVPPYFSSNINALEAAVSTLRNGMSPPASTPSSRETLVVTKTTNSIGSTVATSYTTNVPVSSASPSPGSGNAAAPSAVARNCAGLGVAAIAAGLAVVL